MTGVPAPRGGGGRGGYDLSHPVASARMPSIYSYSHLYTSRLSLLASPVNRVGGLAYGCSFANA